MTCYLTLINRMTECSLVHIINMAKRKRDAAVRWTSETEERFVEQWQQYPCLFDVSSREYHDQLKKTQERFHKCFFFLSFFFSEHDCQHHTQRFCRHDWQFLDPPPWRPMNSRKVVKDSIRWFVRVILVLPVSRPRHGKNLWHYDCLIWHGDHRERQKYCVVWSRH